MRTETASPIQRVSYRMSATSVGSITQNRRATRIDPAAIPRKPAVSAPGQVGKWIGAFCIRLKDTAAAWLARVSPAATTANTDPTEPADQVRARLSTCMEPRTDHDLALQAQIHTHFEKNTPKPILDAAHQVASWIASELERLDPAAKNATHDRLKRYIDLAGSWGQLIAGLREPPENGRDCAVLHEWGSVVLENMYSKREVLTDLNRYSERLLQSIDKANHPLSVDVESALVGAIFAYKPHEEALGADYRELIHSVRNAQTRAGLSTACAKAAAHDPVLDRLSNVFQGEVTAGATSDLPLDTASMEAAADSVFNGVANVFQGEVEAGTPIDPTAAVNDTTMYDDNGVDQLLQNWMRSQRLQNIVEIN